MTLQFNNAAHYGFFLSGTKLTSETGHYVRMSSLMLSALRAAGVFDTLVDSTTAPTTDKLWLDKNFDPPLFKEWDSVGSSWQVMTFDRLFGRAAAGTLTVTGGTGNAIIASAPAGGLIANRLYSITPTAGSTGAVTLQVAGVGTYNVKYPDGTDLSSGEFATSRPKILMFKNGRFDVLFSTADLNAAVAAAAASATAASDAAAAAVAALVNKADKSQTLTGAGLATTSGNLGSSPTVTVSKSSNGQAVAGTDDATAMTPVRTKDAVKDVPWAFDNNTLYKSRSNKDRWLDSYRLNEELNFTGGGSTATDAAVLEGLFNRAKASGRGEIILPRGNMKLEVPCNLVNASATQSVRLVGQGPDATLFLNVTGSQRFFSIGDPAVARSSGIILEGFSLQPNVSMTDSGSGFFMRNTTDIAFKDVICRSMHNGWSMGVGASVTNDVVYTSLSDCGGTSSGASGVAMIRLGSGGILNITGGASRWNASGSHNFIDHDNTSYNWDGFYLSGQFFEQWNKYLCSTGKGMVNVEWTGCQVDRAAIFFQAEPSVTTGSNRNWNIHNVQILGFPAGGGIGVLTSKGSSTDTQAIEDISVTDCVFNGLSDAAIYAANGEILIQGNRFVSCAQLGASAPLGGAVIRIGQGLADVSNNIIRRSLAAPGSAHRYGIQWDGATLATRTENDNKIYGSSVSAQTGTR